MRALYRKAAWTLVCLFVLNSTVFANVLYLTSSASGVSIGSDSNEALSFSRGSGVGSPPSVATDSGLTQQKAQVLSGTGTTSVWYSPPLQAVTISGTIVPNIRLTENSSSANLEDAIRIERTDGTGNVIEEIAFSESSLEIPKTEAARTWNITPTSRTLSNGDRIKVTVYVVNVAGGNILTGFTFRHYYNGTTSTASGDSFITFTETLAPYSASGISKIGGRLYSSIAKVAGRLKASIAKVAGKT